MALREEDGSGQLDRRVPMFMIQGSTLTDMVLAYREAVNVDHTIIPHNSCILCAGMETVRLLPFGWHIGDTERLMAFGWSSMGMLAAQRDWTGPPSRQYRIPAELAATALTLQLSPGNWVLKEEVEWVHSTILQQRQKKQLTACAVVRFIQTMRTLLASRGDTQRDCVRCGRCLLARWTVVLCQKCKRIVQGKQEEKPFTSCAN